MNDELFRSWIDKGDGVVIDAMHRTLMSHHNDRATYKVAVNYHGPEGRDNITFVEKTLAEGAPEAVVQSYLREARILKGLQGDDTLVNVPRLIHPPVVNSKVKSWFRKYEPGHTFSDKHVKLLNGSADLEKQLRLNPMLLHILNEELVNDLRRNRRVLTDGDSIKLRDSVKEMYNRTNFRAEMNEDISDSLNFFDDYSTSVSANSYLARKIPVRHDEKYYSEELSRSLDYIANATGKSLTKLETEAFLDTYVRSLMMLEPTLQHDDPLPFNVLFTEDGLSLIDAGAIVTNPLITPSRFIQYGKLFCPSDLDDRVWDDAYDTYLQTHGLDIGENHFENVFIAQSFDDLRTIGLLSRMAGSSGDCYETKDRMPAIEFRRDKYVGAMQYDLFNARSEFGILKGKFDQAITKLYGRLNCLTTYAQSQSSHSSNE